MRHRGRSGSARDAFAELSDCIPKPARSCSGSGVIATSSIEWALLFAVLTWLNAYRRSLSTLGANEAP